MSVIYLWSVFSFHFSPANNPPAHLYVAMRLFLAFARSAWRIVFMLMNLNKEHKQNKSSYKSRKLQHLQTVFCSDLYSVLL